MSRLRRHGEKETGNEERGKETFRVQKRDFGFKVNSAVEARNERSSQQVKVLSQLLRALASNVEK